MGGVLARSHSSAGSPPEGPCCTLCTLRTKGARGIRTPCEPLRNIFDEEELEPSVTTEESSVVTEGKRQVRRKVRFYNLDAVLSVGHSVSQNCLRDLNQAVRLIADTVNRRDLSGDESRALLRVGPRLRERFGGSAVFGVEKDKGLASALGAVI